MHLPAVHLATAAVAALLAGAALAATPGQPAPDFTVNDASGKPVKLSEFRGKHVVLEVDQSDAVRAETLQREEHAGAAEGIRREGRGLAVGELDQPRSLRVQGRRADGGLDAESRAARRKRC